MFRLIFRLQGWKITKYLPDEIKKCVLVTAPHTSNWDFVIGMAAMSIMKLSAHYTIKKEWLRFPFKRILLSMGAIPIDRSKKSALGEKKSTVDLIVELFNTHDEIRLIIPPEGTRSRVEKWKSGFYYVALQAKVPIALGYIDFEKRECGIGQLIYPSGDFKADMKLIMDFYRNVKGKNPENFALDSEFS